MKIKSLFAGLLLATVALCAIPSLEARHHNHFSLNLGLGGLFVAPAPRVETVVVESYYPYAYPVCYGPFGPRYMVPQPYVREVYVQPRPVFHHGASFGWHSYR